MSYPELLTADQWAAIRGLVAWLDASNGRSHQEIALRLLKLTEEAGEVAQAWIGTVGQNPRKGASHTMADVEAELCDVIVTAAVALASIADDPRAVLDGKLAAIVARVAPREPHAPA
jgi:NTP pyrophosphatase (non-canonical NTP hydrolase)